MALDGHECNAYCRPAEGVHCEVEHVWSQDAGSLDEVFMELRRGYPCDRYGDGAMCVAIEHAPEAPSLTKDGQYEYLLRHFPRHHVGQVMRTHRYLGPALVWETVPEKVPA